MKIPGGTQGIKSGSFSHQTGSSWHSLDSSWMHQAFPPWLQGSMDQGEQARGAGWRLDGQPVLPQRTGGHTGGCAGGHTGRHAGEHTGRVQGWVHGWVHGWIHRQGTGPGAPGPFAELSGHLCRPASAAPPATQTGPASPPSAPRYPHRHPAATAGRAAPSAPSAASAGAGRVLIPGLPSGARGRLRGEAEELPAGPALLPR